AARARSVEIRQDWAATADNERVARSVYRQPVGLTEDRMRPPRSTDPEASEKSEAARPPSRRRARAAPAVDFFTIPEVASQFQVSVRTVRRWIKDEELTVHRFGAVVRVSEADLYRFASLHRGR